MKKFITTAAVFLSILATCYAGNGSKDRLVYDRAVNPIISITVDNINDNTSYVIKDKKGNVVKKGNINAGGTISIRTSRFRSGTYVFEINGEAKEFVIE